MEVVRATKKGYRNFNLTVKLTRAEEKIFKKNKYELRVIDTEERRKLNDEKAEEIIHIISYYFGYNAEEIRIRSRHRDYVTARMFVANYLKKLTELSLDQIGSAIGRDHSLVIHTLKRYNNHIIYQDIKKHDFNIRKLLKEFKII
ncbi:MAG: helix-turn-helix domain-containing protein [Bacteroidota bacterium]